MESPNILLVIGFLGVLSKAEIPEDQGVLVLDTDNFDEAIEKNKFVLVEFYTPWCGHCKLLAPEYVKVAAQLKDEKSDIKLAKVDADENEKLKIKFQISSYPTLKFFREGQVVGYKGTRKQNDIITWLKQKIIPATKTLISVEETKKFIEGNDVVIIAFFKNANHDGVKEILKTAEELDDFSYSFATAHLQDIFAANNIKEDGIYLFRTFDNSPVKYPHKTFHPIDVKLFINKNAVPSFIEFQPIWPPRIFANMLPALYLIVSSKSDDYWSQKDLAEKMAKKYKNKVTVVFIDVEQEENLGFVKNFLEFKKDDAPAMRLATGMRYMKHEPEPGAFTEDKIQNYIDERLGGKGVGWTTSQILPENWDNGPVKILVAKNFRDVINRNRNVFVEFYAPWCGQCKVLTPIWEEVGRKLKDRKDIVIAKMDATLNRLDSIKISGYPTLLLFQGTDQVNVPFHGDRTLESVMEFLEDQGIRMSHGQAQKDEL